MQYINKYQLIAFEEKIAKHWEDGTLPFLIHLSGGNEDFLINYFKDEVKDGDWVLSTHRNHYHALLSGVPEDKLEKAILQGDSMFVFDKSRNFLTSSILSGLTCVATGLAWSLKESDSDSKVHCFLGDGAEEEGHFYEAVMMTMAHRLPCNFIIEDNDRSVDSSIAERNPEKFRFELPSCVIRNIYKATYPHAGNGTSKKIVFKDIKPKK